MIQSKITGTGVAIVTPFTSGFEIDLPALKKLVDHIIEGGVEFIVALGTTGETATLNKEEKKLVVEKVLEYTNGRVPVILGHGGNDTRELVKGLSEWNLNGLSGILSVSPYYNKPNQEGIYQHYKMLSEHSALPIILYNVPGRTGSNMTSDTTLRLAHDFKNIVAVKEASGNLEQCMRIVKNKPSGFLLISGDDNLTLPMISFGASGVISVTAQAIPKLFSEMVRCALKGDYVNASALHFRQFELTEQLFADGNPGGVKAALKFLGVCGDTVRLPLFKANDQVYKNIEQILSKQLALA